MHADLFSLAAVFRDVHDLVLEDKKIRLVFAGQPDHIFVVVFDPAANNFAIRQLDGYRFLFFSERLQVGSFFRSLFGRRRPSFARGATGSLSVKRHSEYFTLSPAEL